MKKILPGRKMNTCTWSGLQKNDDNTWSNLTLNETNPWLNLTKNYEDTILNFNYNHHQTVYFNEYELDFKSLGLKRIIICNNKEYDSLKMIEDGFPKIDQKPFLLAQIVNFLSQGESYEVETTPSPAILWGTFTFYAKPVISNSLFKVTLPWPIGNVKKPEIRYEKDTGRFF